MSTLYSYKSSTYSRGNRTQLIEESFKSGMQFTNTPLPEGFVRTLVNMDIQDFGVALTPRAGLQTTAIHTPEPTATNLCNGSEQIITAGEQYIDNDTYPQFMVLKELTQQSFGQLRKGNIAMLTSTGIEAAAQFSAPTKMYTQAIYDTAAYVVPTDAEIHGVKLNSTAVLARHVGTHAWAQRYYFFDPSTHKIVYSKFNDTSNKFEFVAESGKAIGANTAVTYGYNMLLQNPYNFTNSFNAGGSIIDFDGILPYNNAGDLRLTPVTNESLIFKLYYKVPQNAKYFLKWEWRSTTTDSWTTLKEYDVQFAAITDQTVTFAPPDAGIIIRVSAYGYNASDVRNTYTDATIAVGFNFDKASYGTTTNLGNVNYTLEQASGMVYWKNRLVVWGVPEDPNILFASDVNDPTYFPYPNSVDTFDEPIKYAIPFLDNLLVFTSSKLYLLTLSSDGLGWITDCIQNNLSIADWDIHLIQVVKNMVFFRSGNYYYMVVPKSGGATGELTLAAISKPLYYFFDNFMDSVKSIALDIYDYRGSLTLKHYYNYLDFEDVHNVYVFQTSTQEYLNVCLLYNTTARTWRIYCYGSQAMRVPYKADATQRGTLCSLGSVTQSGAVVAAPQLFRFNASSKDDTYIPREATPSTVATLFNAVHTFRNWQHLDVGYRDHNANFKKRYREMQMVINNISNLALEFHTDFYIDGEQRKNRYNYNVVHELDPVSPNYGLITVEKVLAEPIIAPTTTALGSSASDYAAWRLDVSMLPDVSFWKIRQPVSGKGYTPRFIFTSRNEQAYELLNISYVFRTLNSR